MVQGKAGTLAFTKLVNFPFSIYKETFSSIRNVCHLYKLGSGRSSLRQRNETESYLDRLQGIRTEEASR